MPSHTTLKHISDSQTVIKLFCWTEPGMSSWRALGLFGMEKINTGSHYSRIPKGKVKRSFVHVCSWMCFTIQFQKCVTLHSPSFHLGDLGDIQVTSTSITSMSGVSNPTCPISIPWQTHLISLKHETCLQCFESQYLDPIVHLRSKVLDQNTVDWIPVKCMWGYEEPSQIEKRPKERKTLFEHH